MAESVSFGTAGMRAPVGPAAHHMNVGQVTRISSCIAAWLALNASPRKSGHDRAAFESVRDLGIGQAFHDEDPAPKVVVGYDSRYGSHIFATTTAEVFAGAGFEVFLMPTPTPTPLVPWLIRKWGLDGGVQITASHNPASDNGYKVYMGNGRQMPRSGEVAVERLLVDAPAASAIPRVTVRPCQDVVRRYIDEVTAVVIPEQGDLLRINNERASLTIALTALHGVGGRSIMQALQTAGFAQVHSVASQHYPDPTFPTVSFPNPEEPSALVELFELGEQVQADVLLALDPDADRCAVGIRTKAGHLKMLRGDETGPLLATRLVPRYSGEGQRPVVATTVVSSQLLGVIAEDMGWDLRLTFTGFKNLNAAAGDEPVTFAYEEAMGISPTPWIVDDKDGIATALIVASWAAELHAKGLDFDDELEALYRRYGYFTGTQVSVRTQDPSALMHTCIENLPHRLCGVDVTAKTVPVLSNTCGMSESSRPPAGLVLNGECEVGKVRVIVRASGTEPKVKVYIEVVQENGSTADRGSAVALVDALAAELSTLLARL
ncbi:phospho-sugar mutase [Corynebacterium felinum]|uniref:Phosphomannomutase n=1 Tax=Corynebacterium felinum TaxID=131318 RepID=A0ABU2B8A6_9CORY|nr:phospho-sugar mutase [Corynebacterium felinum]MDF5820202.1 phospho-sugar mutase [Corynebacterium felinum]MDR7354841.1 phosphomannomutase [Corynebacterium felinum]WJY94201.1 putative phosphomannomutase [Corynebacterium felinum]